MLIEGVFSGSDRASIRRPIILLLLPVVRIGNCKHCILCPRCAESEQECTYWKAEQVSILVSTDGDVSDLELPNYSVIEQSEATHTIARDVFDGFGAIVVANQGDAVSFVRVTEDGWRYDVFINNDRKVVLITGAKI